MEKTLKKYKKKQLIMLLIDTFKIKERIEEDNMLLRNELKEVKELLDKNNNKLPNHEKEYTQDTLKKIKYLEKRIKVVKNETHVKMYQDELKRLK